MGVTDVGAFVRGHLRGATPELGVTATVVDADHAGLDVYIRSPAAGVGLTDAQLRASPVPVSGTVTTGGLTDTQLRASAFAVQATLAAETTKVIGTVNQGTSPWVIGHAALPSSQGQKTMGTSFGVVIAADQASIPVAATLTAETTKVIGTVNQGTSPWVTSRNWTLASGTDSVNVGNFPATQAVSIAAMPSTPVTGAFFQTVQPVSVTAQDSDLLLETKKMTTLLALLLQQFNLNASDLEGVF